jgi:phosphoenolpyruvate-protein kinase (PTS system EI component)
VWYARIDEQMLLDAIAQMSTDLEKGKCKAERKALKSATKTATANFDKARRKTSMKAAQKLTELVDGHYQFLEEPPLLSRAVVSADDRRVVGWASGTTGQRCPMTGAGCSSATS